MGIILQNPMIVKGGSDGVFFLPCGVGSPWLYDVPIACVSLFLDATDGEMAPRIVAHGADQSSTIGTRTRYAPRDSTG